jgi:bifunctional non-homologous end joining protein LigD
MRKIKVARLLRARPDGMFIAQSEAGATEPELFGAACRVGLEGLVSKPRGRRYSAGPSKDWIKVKNPDASEGDGRPAI